MKTLPFLRAAILLLTAEADPSPLTSAVRYANASLRSVPGALSRVFLGMLAGSALALSTHADEITLFDGTSTVTVVYAAEGGTPIAKVVELLGHARRAW